MSKIEELTEKIIKLVTKNLESDDGRFYIVYDWQVSDLKDICYKIDSLSEKLEINLKETMKETITQAECIESGGHFWNEYSANEGVDEFGRKTGISLLMAYKEEPRYRICGLCRCKQRLQPAEWIETKKGIK